MAAAARGSCTNMSLMFFNTTFNGNISQWGTSRVTSTYSMFEAAPLFHQDLRLWDVSSVTTFSRMFNGARAFNGDVTTWDMRRAVDLTYMFSTATAFNRDVSSWDVSCVTRTLGMFERAGEFDQPIGAWAMTHAVTEVGRMFWSATKFDQDLSNCKDVFCACTGRSANYCYLPVDRMAQGVNSRQSCEAWQ